MHIIKPISLLYRSVNAKRRAYLILLFPSCSHILVAHPGSGARWATTLLKFATLLPVRAQLLHGTKRASAAFEQGHHMSVQKLHNLLGGKKKP